MGAPGSARRAWQRLGLLLLAAATVGACYLALNRDLDGSPDVTPAATQSAATPPKVPDQRRADFRKGDGLPDGSVTYDSPSSSSGLALTGKGLTHGPMRPGGTDVPGLGIVETELLSFVRSMGFRVRFATEGPESSAESGAESGSAVMVAWQSSAVAAYSGGAGSLPYGLRFVTTPGTWALSVIRDGEEVLAEGTYDASAGALEFQVVTDGAKAFVTDPAGKVTPVTDARLEEVAGAFASWALVETAPGQVPAVIESVWAG